MEGCVLPKADATFSHLKRPAVQGSFNKPADPDNQFTVYVTPFGDQRKGSCFQSPSNGTYLVYDDPDDFASWTKITGQGRSAYVNARGKDESAKLRAESRCMIKEFYYAKSKELSKLVYKLSIRMAANAVFAGCDLFFGDMLCMLQDMQLTGIRLPGMRSFDTIPNFDFNGIGSQFGKLIAVEQGADIDMSSEGENKQEEEEEGKTKEKAEDNLGSSEEEGKQEEKEEEKTKEKAEDNFGSSEEEGKQEEEEEEKENKEKEEDHIGDQVQEEVEQKVLQKALTYPLDQKTGFRGGLDPLKANHSVHTTWLDSCREVAMTEVEQAANHVFEVAMTEVEQAANGRHD